MLGYHGGFPFPAYHEAGVYETVVVVFPSSPSLLLFERDDKSFNLSFSWRVCGGALLNLKGFLHQSTSAVEVVYC